MRTLAAAAAATLVLVLGVAGSTAANGPLTRVLVDPFADGMGYHQSVVDGRTVAAANPARAGNYANKSTIVSVGEVGKIYDGGASDLGYAVSVDGGTSWNRGMLPLTVQGGAATTCGGTLTRAGVGSVAYDARFDIWLAAGIGIAGNSVPQAVVVDRGTVDFGTKDMSWGPPICAHTVSTQPGAQDAPDFGWIACDNWVNSKGFGRCYLVYDNNGNGNRALVLVSTDGGLSWSPSTDTPNNAQGLPGNGNTGDVSGETTLASPAGSGTAAHAGDTNIKVASVVGIGTSLAAASAAGDTNIKVTSTAPFFTTTLAAAANAGDTNIKVASVTALAPGATIDIDTGATESRTIAAVGTAGATGTGVTLTSALANAHPSGAQVTPAGQQIQVDTGANAERATIRTLGTAGATGTGVTLTAPLVSAHASGAQVDDATIRVDVDGSGGNQEIVDVTSVGTAGATGTGISFTPALAADHVTGAHVASTTAPQVGHTGDAGAVVVVQPPPPGSAPGSVCGRVVISATSSGVSWWTSSDCGANWSAETQILPNMTATHSVAAGLRTSLLPTASVDGAGNVYVVWQTRSFRVGSVASTPNDIALAVMPAPTAAIPYPPFGAPQRIPIETDNTTANPVDHFIPGIAADPTATGRLGLFYYGYPVAACAYADPGNPGNQCDLELGYVSSTDGGATWAPPQFLAHMPLSSIMRSSQGPMVGDELGAAVIPAGPYAGNAIAGAAIGTVDTTLNEALWVPTHGLPVGTG